MDFSNILNIIGGGLLVSLIGYVVFIIKTGRINQAKINKLETDKKVKEIFDEVSNHSLDELADDINKLSNPK